MQDDIITVQLEVMKDSPKETKVQRTFEWNSKHSRSPMITSAGSY